MKVGHARFDLTPTGEFHLIGFRNENRMHPASGVHDHIYCNSLLIEIDGRKLFIFSADFLEFEESMAEDVKTMLADEYGIDRDMVVLCATHDHSSVVSYHKGWYTHKFDQRYYDFLIDTIVGSYEECERTMVSATVEYGSKVILGYYGNRNHPGRPADNEVIVVKFIDEDGRAFAGMVNWAVHSTVISAENTWLTAEFAGNVSEKLEPYFGFVPAMVVGAAGDCSNRNQRQGRDFAELERVSTGMAKEIAVIDTARNLTLDRMINQTLYHTIHTDSYHLEAKGEVIDLGDLQLFVFGGELGSKFGIEMKETAGKPALVLGYANGYYGYWLPKEEYDISFETKTSPIPAGQGEELVAKFEQASRLLDAR